MSVHTMSSSINGEYLSGLKKETSLSHISPDETHHQQYLDVLDLKTHSLLTVSALEMHHEVNKAEGYPEPTSVGFNTVVRGQDVGDLPAEYVVRGLRSHEMPVIGVYVDPRIIPGFRYLVRKIGTEHCLFDRRALCLKSVGMGYGKRLTFEGDSLHVSDNYFWSDSHPDGFAFSLDAVQPGDTLSIYGSTGSGVIGEVKVEKFPSVQEEISSKVVNGVVTKRVRVILECSVTYVQQFHHHMMNLNKVRVIEHITGEAVVVRRKSCRIASLDSIQNVALPCIPGICTLQVE